jgi:MarR family
MTQEMAQRVPDAAERVALKLEEFLPYRLNVCSSLVSHALSRIYADRYKIGVPEWRVLVTLGQFGAMTAKTIGDHSHMHKTKVSRAVALLERRKLVTRRANRADLREAFLSLTAAGRISTMSWHQSRSTLRVTFWNRSMPLIEQRLTARS